MFRPQNSKLADEYDLSLECLLPEAPPTRDVIDLLGDLAAQEQRELAQSAPVQPPAIKSRKRKDPPSGILPAIARNSFFSMNERLPPVQDSKVDLSPICKSVLAKILGGCKLSTFVDAEKLWLRGAEVSFQGVKYKIATVEIIPVFNSMIEVVNIDLILDFYNRYFVAAEHLPKIAHEKLYPVFIKVLKGESNYNFKIAIWEKCSAFVEWLRTSKTSMLKVLMLTIQQPSISKITTDIWNNNENIRNACKYESDSVQIENIIKNLMQLPSGMFEELLKPDTVVYAMVKKLSEANIIRFSSSYHSMQGLSQIKFKAFLALIDNKVALEKTIARLRRREIVKYFVVELKNRIKELDLEQSCSLNLSL